MNKKRDRWNIDDVYIITRRCDYSQRQTPLAVGVFFLFFVEDFRFVSSVRRMLCGPHDFLRSVFFLHPTPAPYTESLKTRHNTRTQTHTRTQLLFTRHETV